MTEAEGAREGVESDLGGASCYYTFHPLPRTGAAEGERSFADAQDDKGRARLGRAPGQSMVMKVTEWAGMETEPLRTLRVVW